MTEPVQPSAAPALDVERRIKIEIDRVPPTLADALKAKVKRDGLSVRSVTLTLWKSWVEKNDA